MTKRFGSIGEFDTDPWANYGTPAPFDQEFCIILNQAVAGGYFGDWAKNYPEPAPWTSKSKFPQTDFWNGRSQRQRTWKDPTFKVDYVKVYAL
jgi:hypothetical protein